MRLNIHQYAIKNIRNCIRNHDKDPALAGVCEVSEDDIAKWVFPALKLRITIDKYVLRCETIDGAANVYLWNDLMHGEPIRPPMRTMLDAMRDKQFETISTSYGPDAGTWSRLLLPGFIVLSVWDALLMYNRTV
ncbi:MAG: hypothetical protein IPM33_00325 [Phycisphaerales bacterium]|nr:hypothetical protein [Phycisphaerales bacterium]